MKIYYLFSFFSVVLYTIFAKNISYVNKREETSDECQYINSMLGENESYNCCDYYLYDLEEEDTPKNIIKCENGHITEM